MTNSFAGRKIILLCPTFYQYRNIIKSEIENMGGEVYAFDERPQKSSLFKVLLRLGFERLTGLAIDNYYNTIITNLEQEDVTDIFIVNAEAVNVSIINRMRSKFFKAKFTLYMWDSVKNKNKVKNIVDLFDEVYSFDPSDCESDSRFKFEPLFYGHEYANEKANYHEDIEFSFIGSIHSDRVNIVFNVLESIGDGFVYLFSPSKLFTLLKCITGKDRLRYLTNVKYQKMSIQEVSDIFSRSKCVLDINHPNQNGLTMRTFEVLGAGKKLITTNENIKSYDFYNKKQVLIIDRNNVSKSDVNAFINSDVHDYVVMDKYRIDNWIKRILA
ncbi:hypothetical protein [Vibrio parahaemolyticus]|uniref:hypothetical protein n=1 Tax=Vibrio parahaemolyticus TaxID=670 RepID=UPI00112052FC|nr:hypothetical protein [Vibrio parahaemolyticus]TOM97333.1 hypothetical protein CGH65_19980 [Vibrio parahaemolyticus]